MLGRKMYKTKLCLLYQRGRCPRQNCSFAHGEGRRDYRSGDLRDKLDRRQSPIRRYSPGREGRAYHSFRNYKPDRGSSLSRSPIRRSERRSKKKQSVDGESDISGSHKLSDGVDDVRKENASSFDEKAEKGIYEEQLRQAKLDIEKLDDHKSHLEIFLEKKFEEAHKLSSKIEDLEMLLSREQEDCKRINSKIEKFIKAYGRYIKAQDDLRRSQARFQKIGDQLGLDVSKVGANEEDSSINVLSDGDPNADFQESTPNNMVPNSSSSMRKRSFVHAAAIEEGKFGNVPKKSKHYAVLPKPEKLVRPEGPSFSAEDAAKDSESIKFSHGKKDLPMSLSDGFKRKRGKISPDLGFLTKNRSSDVERALPSTSIAANVIDELIEDIEIDEKSNEMVAATPNENVIVEKKVSSSHVPPLPPPVNLNAYKQYEGDDEDVDVEKVDSEMVDIDLNEVDIEQ